MANTNVHKPNYQTDMVCISDAASLCSVAPSLHELDAELAQYGDLLDVADDDAALTDDNTALLPADVCEGFAADVNPFDVVESVQRLNELLPSEPEELDQLALRPTAASLGLKDAIKECLGTDPNELGN